MLVFDKRLSRSRMRLLTASGQGSPRLLRPKFVLLRTTHMITVLGSPRRLCDGIARRESLKIGGLSALGGFTLSDLLRAEERRSTSGRPGRAKNVIVIFLVGGAASQDMYDLKPDAPADIRGEFKP